jgi:ACR3 family arsenite transporter
VKELGFLDRYLTVWILLAMIFGLTLGAFAPGVSGFIGGLSINEVNIPIAIGLIAMMYPPLAKVDFKSLPDVLSDKRLLSFSLVLNWLIGPLLMFCLAVVFLRNSPELMSGVIIIGIARCIAMVLVWNDLADGDRSYGAALVAINSVFQVVTFSLYAWFFLTIAPTWIGITAVSINIPLSFVAKNVFMYLGIPFILGIGLRYLFVKRKGKIWYNEKYLPQIGPITLVSLLLTIVLMFSLQGNRIITQPSEVIIVAVPLMIYFLLMWGISYFFGKKLGACDAKNRAIAFTAAGNNFELAIAVSIGIFGIHSPQAFVGVIGPLIEVPALLLLVKISQKLSSS